MRLILAALCLSSASLALAAKTYPGETAAETARHNACRDWPGGPGSKYQPVVDAARRRAGDPATDIVSDRWPAAATVAGIWFVDEQGVEQNKMLIESQARTEWSGSNEVIARINGRSSAIASPEYQVFRMGALALIVPAVFGRPGALPRYQSGRSRQNPWLNLVQFPPDSRGDDCVSLNQVSRKNENFVSGCGDPWQDGIDPANELACLNGKTYLRCHLWCREQVENATLNYVPGPCP